MAFRSSTIQLWPTLEPPVPVQALPRHIAIIMDGNGRWAMQRRFLRIRGHEAGAEAVRSAVQYCGQIGLNYLTLYAFSSENWRRPTTEVKFLMRLLKRYLVREIEELDANDVRLTAIGRLEQLPAVVRNELRRCMERTASNRGLTLCLALNYGAQAEYLDALRALLQEVRRGALRPEEIDAGLLERQLYTREMPPVDLMIRTAGEQRVSNFLLWQASEAEFVGAPLCWPDFRRDQLREAILEFARRRTLSTSGTRQGAPD